MWKLRNSSSSPFKVQNLLSYSYFLTPCELGPFSIQYSYSRWFAFRPKIFMEQRKSFPEFIQFCFFLRNFQFPHSLEWRFSSILLLKGNFQITLICSSYYYFPTCILLSSLKKQIEQICRKKPMFIQIMIHIWTFSR